MFAIGDFARLGCVSVRMLRHYDGIGLLRPARVDANGYRFYEAGQLARLNRIIALKDLGFTLQRVGAILDEQVSDEELRGMLRLRRAELAAMIAADTERLTQVESRLRALAGDAAAPAADVVVKSIPAVRVAELTGVAGGFAPEEIGPVIRPLYPELFDKLDRARLAPSGPAIAYYDTSPAGDDTIIVHAAVPVAAGPAGPAGPAGVQDFAIVDLPEVPAAATIVHRGSMDDCLPSYQALARWIDAQGHLGAGGARELYVDYCPDGDPARFVTELQAPFTPASTPDR